MRLRRRFLGAAATAVLLAAGCQAVLGLDDPTVVRPEADVDAMPQSDGADDLDEGDSGLRDAPEDAPIVDAGCWADVILVANDWTDFLNTPVPQPAAATGVSNRASYDASVPGEVYDNVTKLTWLVEADGGTSPTGTQAEAIAACAARGARLPTRMELVTIQNWYPAPDASTGADPVLFPDTVEAYYRTSVPTSSNVKWGWAVFFGSIGFATISNADLTAKYRYRCVRGPSPEQPLTHRYAVSPACDVVRDLGTRLEWERGRGKAAKYSLAEAHCESLPKLGRNDWRIPTYSELESIVYTKRENPAIDPLVFETEQGIYWTSTLPGRFPNNRIVVPFSDGQTTEVRNDEVTDVGVRCVRTMD